MNGACKVWLVVALFLLEPVGPTFAGEQRDLLDATWLLRSSEPCRIDTLRWRRASRNYVQREWKMISSSPTP
jgi:hypothetical protein